MALYKGDKRYALSTNNPGNIIPLEVTKDGVYTAPTGVDGYNPVTMKNGMPFISMGSHTDADGIWHKPADWDDIESIDLTNKQEMYILYACHLTGTDWCRIQISGTGTLSWSYGHVSNGTYTMHQNSSETTVNNNSYAVLYLNNIQDDYIVIRIKTTGNLYYCKFADWVATSDINYTMPFRTQPAIMRYGRLPKGTSIQNSATYHLESDNILDFAKDYQNTTTTISVNASYQSAVNLQRWRCDGWDLAKNKITNFSNFFYDCRCLCDVPKVLDLSNLVTSSTTTVAAMFYACFCLNTRLIVNNWDLSNVTSMSSLFDSCLSLKRIEGTETWNSAPKCSSINAMFSSCYALTGNINLSNCYFGNGTANITNISYMFSSCYSLTSINLSNLNMSKCTNVSYLFNSTRSLKELILNNITPITNVCTNTNSIFNCTGLSNELILNNWDFSGCTVNFLLSGFYSSTALKKLVLNNCTAPSNITINDGSTCCYVRYSYNLKYLDVSFLDMSIFSNTATHLYAFRDLYNLVDFYPPKNISKNFNLANNNQLSHDSLIRIINNLKTLASGTTATLTIGTYNIAKLTSEEKAIATNKGWTLA